MFSYTEPREAVLQYKGLLIGLKGSWKAADVAEGQRHGKSVILRFEGVNDRDTAESLLGAEIGVERSDLPDPAEGQFYWSDLIGLTVVHRDGKLLGKIVSMLETGAHDVMVVQGEEERLIPFVMNEVVIGVDLATRCVNVDWEWD